MRALVTGGSSGMGLEYARELSRRGCELLLVSNRNDELEKARKELGCEICCMDLAVPGAGEALFHWCEERGLQIDLLINNAGMFFMQNLSAENLPKAEAMLRLHNETVVSLCTLFGARMKARGQGYILNVSSMTAWIPAPGITMYAATKAFLKSFGKSLSHELRPYGVTVTTVFPSAVDTPLYPLSDGLRRAGRRLGVIWTPRRLVKRALRGLFHRRRLVRPGILNYLVPALVRLLPNPLIDRIWLRWSRR